MLQPAGVMRARSEDGEVTEGVANGASSNEPPLLVLHDPKWDPKWHCDLENFDMERFFKEAEVTEYCAKVLQGRFDKFCTQPPDGEAAYLGPNDFQRFNAHYKICPPEDEEHYFRVMDSCGEQRVYFRDFLTGCAAANPVTPHILNSYTGYVRARYIFNFYNVSCSGTLEFEELARLLADAKQHLNEPQEKQRRQIQEHAQELGEVSAVTLRINSLSGPLCDVRASTRWTGLKVRREVSRQLQVPVEGQELVIGTKALTLSGVLEDLIPDGASCVQVSMVRTNWEMWPCQLEPCISDDVGGLERLVHISFHNFYKAITQEQLRGTSRLFRFRKSILQFSEAQKARAKHGKVVLGSAAAGGGA